METYEASTRKNVKGYLVNQARASKLIQVLLQQPLQPPAEFASQQGISLAGWEFGAPFHPGFDRLRAAIRDLLDQRAPLAAGRAASQEASAATK